MTSTELSPFQMHLSAEVATILVGDRNGLVREVYENGDIALRIIDNSTNTEIWVYRDGANILRGSTIDDRFERADFNSLEDLHDAVVARIKELG